MGKASGGGLQRKGSGSLGGGPLGPRARYRLKPRLAKISAVFPPLGSCCQVIGLCSHCLPCCWFPLPLPLPLPRPLPAAGPVGEGREKDLDFWGDLLLCLLAGDIFLGDLARFLGVFGLKNTLLGCLEA